MHTETHMCTQDTNVSIRKKMRSEDAAFTLWEVNWQHEHTNCAMPSIANDINRV